MTGLLFWIAGVMFTVGYAVLGEGPRLKEITGEKVALALFAIVLWPLMLGAELRGVPNPPEEGNGADDGA